MLNQVCLHGYLIQAKDFQNLSLFEVLAGLIATLQVKKQRFDSVQVLQVGQVGFTIDNSNSLVTPHFSKTPQIALGIQQG